MWKVQSYFFENFLQSEDIGFVSKVSGFGKCSRNVFTYLSKARVTLNNRCLPEDREGFLLIGKNVIIEFMLPQHPISLTTGLFFEKAAFVTAFTIREDVPASTLGIS